MQPIKNRLRLLAVLGLAIALPSIARAISADDIARTQKILTTVLELSAKYPAAAGNIVAPAPQTNQAGPYFLPYNSKGEMTEWANKAINAQVGAALGAKAGEEAGKAVTSRIPFGGLLNGAAKNKGKELGAIAAVGGTEFIKTSSDQSFANLDDYAVHLHVTHAGNANFAQALATAMAIYPSLEKSYQPSIKGAYERAAKAAKAPPKK